MANNKVRWGVLSTAAIGVKKVLPGMQKGEWSHIAAISSRDHAKAVEAASALGIAKVYGSYEELLADPSIEAIYNPLPNHMHIPWTIKAAEAGKHGTFSDCEKLLPYVAEASGFLAVLTPHEIKDAFRDTKEKAHKAWAENARRQPEGLRRE